MKLYYSTEFNLAFAEFTEPINIPSERGWGWAFISVKHRVFLTDAIFKKKYGGVISLTKIYPN
jgi:hypothetical protein